MTVTSGFFRVIIALALSFPVFVSAQEVVSGEEIYKKKCSGCHGVDGTIKAYGISRQLIEIPADEMREKLKFYTTNAVRNSSGVTAVMGKQTARLDKIEYRAVLEYILQFAPGAPK